MYLGVGINTSTGQRAGGIPFAADVKSRWNLTDANNLTLSGSDITAVADSGKANNPLTHQANAYMQWDGSEATATSSVNNYQAGSAGDYNMLHQASGGTYFVVLKSSSTGTNESYPINTRVSAGEGFDNRVDLSGGDQRYRTVLENSSNVNYTANADNKTLNLDIPVILSGRIGSADDDNVTMYEDGFEVFSNTDSGYTWGTGNHSDPLRIAVSWTGTLYDVIIYDRKLTVDEHAKVCHYLRQYHSALDTVADVYHLIGASNAEGLGAGGSLPAEYTGIIEKSYIWAHKDGDSITNTTPEFYPHEQANSHVDYTTSDFGLDLSMMATATEETERKGFLLKSTESGSDMYAKWNPTDQPSLSSGWDEYAERYAAMCFFLNKRGFSVRNKACVVGLGENDATASFRYNDYQDNMEKLNVSIRNLVRSDFDIVHVMCSTEQAGDTSARTDSQMGGQSTVRTAQTTVAAAEANTYTYQAIVGGESPVYSITYNEASPNGIHYDAATLPTMGVNLGAMAAYLGVNAPTQATLVVDGENNVFYDGTTFSQDLTDIATVTRSTTGTYLDAGGIVRTAAINEPRYSFFDGRRSLLIERSATNEVIQSYDMPALATGGTLIGASFSDLGETAPDGSQTFYAFVEATNNGEHWLNGVGPEPINGQVYCYSFYVKAISGSAQRYVTMRGFGQAGGTSYPVFDPINGTIVRQGSSWFNTRIEAIGNGVYRCSACTTSSTDTFRTSFGLSNVTNPSAQPSYQGDGSSGVYIWGVQQEEDVLSSYVPTNGSQVTRSSDLISDSVGDWLNQSGGTIFADAYTLEIANTSPSTLQIDDGTNDNRLLLRFNSTTSHRAISVDGSSTVLAANSGTAQTAPAYVKGAARILENDLAVSAEGDSVNTDTSGAVAGGFTNFNLGSTATAGGLLKGGLAKLKYYDYGRTDAQLEKDSS